MKDLVVRTISMMAVIVALIGYNMKVQIREKDAEIAKINSQLQYSKQEAEYYKNYVMEISGMEEEDSADESKYKDGTYEGTAMGFGGNITVAVQIENGIITTIDVVKAKDEDGAYLEMAKDIIGHIIDDNSTDVDTISGATFSSTGIRDAVSKALESAEK